MVLSSLSAARPAGLAALGLLLVGCSSSPDPPKPAFPDVDACHGWDRALPVDGCDPLGPERPDACDPATGRSYHCALEKLYCFDCRAAGEFCGWGDGRYECGFWGAPAPSADGVVDPPYCVRPPCLPSCDGRECGADGAGGICGVCGEGQVCSPTTFRCEEAGPGCVPRLSPGCHGCACEDEVCDTLPRCCGLPPFDGDGHWDAECADACRAVGGCKPGPGCEEAPGRAGCDGCACEAEVCADDPSCCDPPQDGRQGGWDLACVGRCAELHGCGAPSGCEPRVEPGCPGCLCEADVCSPDWAPDCCERQWDWECAQKCRISGEGCGRPVGCFPADWPGCAGCDCEACVLSRLPGCAQRWDRQCVLLCEQECGGCVFRPAPEVCDGLDNDRDGEVDEPPEQGGSLCEADRRPCFSSSCAAGRCESVFSAPCLYFGSAELQDLTDRAAAGEVSPLGFDWARFVDDTLARAAHLAGAGPYTRHVVVEGGNDFKYTFGPSQPERRGGDPAYYWTKMFQEQELDNIATRINTLTLGWLLARQVAGQEAWDDGQKPWGEHAATLLARARAMVEDLCRWDYWTDPDSRGGWAPEELLGRPDLDHGHAAMVVALFLDAARTTLAPGEREALLGCLLDAEPTRVAGVRGTSSNVPMLTGGQPLQDVVDYYLAPGDDGGPRLSSAYPFSPNGFAVISSALAVTGASILLERYLPEDRQLLDDAELDRAGDWLDTGISGVRALFELHPPGAGSAEGQSYGSYAMDSLARVMALRDRLVRMGEERVDGEPLARDLPTAVPRYLWSALSPDLSSLANLGISRQKLCWRRPAAYLASVGSDLAGGYLRETGITAGSTAFARPLAWAWLLDAERARTPEETVFAWPDIGHGSVRSGWGEDGLALVFKSGPPVGEAQKDHYDSGSFLLGSGGQWILSDLGGYNHESALHSTWLVEGQGQEHLTGGRLLNAGGAAGPLAGLCGEFSATYGEGVLDLAQRCVYTLDGKHAVIVDHAEAARARDLTYLLQRHTGGWAEIEDAGGEPLLWVGGDGGPHRGVYVVSSSEEHWTLRPPPESHPVSPDLEDHPALTVTRPWSTEPQDNARFEDGLRRWDPRCPDGETHRHVSDGCHEGRGCAVIDLVRDLPAELCDPPDADADPDALCLCGPPKSGYYYGAFAGVEPGERVRLSAWVRTEDSSAKVRLQFYGPDEQGESVYLADCSSRHRGGREWTRVTTSCLVPHSTPDGRVLGIDRMRPALESDGTGRTWFDEVTLQVGEAVTLPLDDPGFDLPLGADCERRDAAPWRCRCGNSSHRTTSDGCRGDAGDRCAVIDLSDASPCPDGGTHSGWLYGAFLDVQPGQRAWLSAWVNREEQGDARVKVRLQFFGPGEQYLSDCYSEPGGDEPRSWTLVTTGCVVPAGAERMRPALELAGEGRARFDDVELTTDAAAPLREHALHLLSLRVGDRNRNPGFERGMDQWVARCSNASHTILEDAGVCAEGDRCAVIHITEEQPCEAGEPRPAGRYQGTPQRVGPGERLGMSALVKLDPQVGEGEDRPDGLEVEAGLHLLDDSGVVETCSAREVPQAAGDGWTRWETGGDGCDVGSAGGADRARPYVQLNVTVNGALDGTRRLLVDEVELTRPDGGVHPPSVVRRAPGSLDVVEGDRRLALCAPSEPTGPAPSTCRWAGEAGSGTVRFSGDLAVVEGDAAVTGLRRVGLVRMHRPELGAALELDGLVRLEVAEVPADADQPPPPLVLHARSGVVDDGDEGGERLVVETTPGLGFTLYWADRPEVSGAVSVNGAEVQPERGREDGMMRVIWPPE